MKDRERMLLDKMTTEDLMDLEITDCAEKALSAHMPPQSSNIDIE